MLTDGVRQWQLQQVGSNVGHSRYCVCDSSRSLGGALGTGRVRSSLSCCVCPALTGAATAGVCEAHLHVVLSESC